MAGVEYPQNDFTQMIEMVSRRNASGVVGLPGPATGEPQPTVRSAGLGRVVEQADAAAPDVPLSAQEMHELNEAARAAGIKDERIGTAGPAVGSDVQSNYATLEEAMAAGSSVRTEAPSAGAPVMTRQGPRGPVGRPAPQATFVPQAPRLPNFKNVQGIDLISGIVLVDDMEFKMHPQHIAELRRYAVETARDDIQKRLTEAMNMFTLEEAPAEEGSDEEGTTGEAADVQRESSGDSAQPTG
jgi:hypothetical protein